MKITKAQNPTPRTQRASKWSYERTRQVPDGQTPLAGDLRRPHLPAGLPGSQARTVVKITVAFSATLLTKVWSPSYLARVLRGLAYLLAKVLRLSASLCRTSLASTSVRRRFVGG